MLRIDSHQHFWKFDAMRDSWINDDMASIRRDFVPADLEKLLSDNQMDGCVVVQSDQSEAENNFQLENANTYPFIKGIVGWVDLQSANVEERLAHWSQYEKMKGFRHVLQGESNRALMLTPNFMRGIQKLKKHQFTYDILIFPDQLGYTLEFVQSFPDQLFVIDHMAKPSIKTQEMSEWKKMMIAIGAYKNVYCKISGMVTEADWKAWKKDDFSVYIDTVVEAFGIERLMFGSDWPVCLVAATYDQVVGLVKDYFSTFSASEQAMLFGGNACKFYNLK